MAYACCFILKFRVADLGVFSEIQSALFMQTAGTHTDNFVDQKVADERHAKAPGKGDEYTQPLNADALKVEQIARKENPRCKCSPSAAKAVHADGIDHIIDFETGDKFGRRLGAAILPSPIRVRGLSALQHPKELNRG